MINRFLVTFPAMILLKHEGNIVQRYHVFYWESLKRNRISNEEIASQPVLSLEKDDGMDVFPPIIFLGSGIWKILISVGYKDTILEEMYRIEC